VEAETGAVARGGEGGLDVQFISGKLLEGGGGALKELFGFGIDLRVELTPCDDRQTYDQDPNAQL
jgi:hypothetical protein